MNQYQINYSNNMILRQVSDIFFNIISFIIIIYFSKYLVSNPISCFLFYFIFCFIIFAFFTLSVSKNLEDEEKSNEYVVEKIVDKSDEQNKSKNKSKGKNKYKTLLKKFKNLKNDFIQAKNDIDNIKKEITKTNENNTTIYSSDAEDSAMNDLIQKFVDDIKDVPDDEANQKENNFEMIEN